MNIRKLLCIGSKPAGWGKIMSGNKVPEPVAQKRGNYRKRKKFQAEMLPDFWKSVIYRNIAMQWELPNPKYLPISKTGWRR